MRHIAMAVLCLGLFAAPVANAENYYVAPHGSDRNSGSLAAPWRTISQAVHRVQPGDHIWLLKGTYQGGVVIDRAGRPDQWITLEAYHHQKVIVKGQGHENDLYFYNDGFAPLYWEVKGLDLEGGNEYVVKIDVPDVRIIGNDLHGSHDDIVKMVRTAANIVLAHNQIHDNDARDGANAQGVDIVGASNVLVAYNHVYNIPSIGMYAKGNASHVIFEHNVLDHIYDRGIMLGQSTGKQFLFPGRTYESYDSVIRDNVIRHTGSACLSTSSSLRPQIYDNFCDDVAIHSTAGIFVSNESELRQGGTDVDIHNNVIILGGNRPAIQIAPNAMSDDRTLHINNNLYWSKRGTRAVGFSWDRGLGEDKPSFYFVTFAKWQRLTGLDRSSTVAPPTLALRREILGFGASAPEAVSSLR